MNKKLMQLIKDNLNKVEGKLIIVNADDSSEATIYLYDIIDDYWGISAQDFCKELLALRGKTVHLRINSPGGDVFAAEAMATAIREHGDVHGHIDGYAASAATRVASACKDVEIAPSGFYMIHNAWTFAYGNKEELRQTAELLQKVDESIIADYARKTGNDTTQIVDWMNAETWFSAQEALDNGFVNAIAKTEADNTAAQAKNWNLAAFNNAPKPAEPHPENMEKLLQQSNAQRQFNANRLRMFELT
ncbi:MAG TPA: head maturation protease, ClpP-related [Methylophilus sp.]|uniref:head maturation protease, ClpP-related n=1 Tax=Methylophilus sp. TaxID=29541 RepID=UPI002C8D8D7F|nr:head maturation protease, ClpP-related [Methylophilus sp.]HSH86881.1 head maturation protease, ClpP-related [Methylophilus sp.]